MALPPLTYGDCARIIRGEPPPLRWQLESYIREKRQQIWDDAPGCDGTPGMVLLSGRLCAIHYVAAEIAKLEGDTERDAMFRASAYELADRNEELRKSANG